MTHLEWLAEELDATEEAVSSPFFLSTLPKTEDDFYPDDEE